MKISYDKVLKGFKAETQEAEEEIERRKSQSSAKRSCIEEECPNPSCSKLVKDLESEIDELRKYAEQAESTKESLSKLESLRKVLAYIIFFVITIWLILVFVLVFLGSLDVVYFKGACNPSTDNVLFKSFDVISDSCTYVRHGTVLALSEKIVITLITTTTVNVLGLAYIVARWLYPEPKKKKKGKKKKKTKKQ